MTSPLVHPVATREPRRDVISISVHVTSRRFSSDSDWSPSGDVIRSPVSPGDVIVDAMTSSRISRSIGRSRDLLMSYVSGKQTNRIEDNSSNQQLINNNLHLTTKWAGNSHQRLNFKLCPLQKTQYCPRPSDILKPNAKISPAAKAPLTLWAPALRGLQGLQLRPSDSKKMF